MAYESNNDTQHPLHRLVQAWCAKVELAKKARKDFDDVAAQCNEFFAGATGFMWKSGFMHKYFGGSIPTRFKITLAKAFEFVAQYGPNLYWANPQRKVSPVEEFHYTWEDFLPDDWLPPPPPQLPPPPPPDAPPEIVQQYQQLQAMANQPPPEVQQAQQIFQQAEWRKGQRKRADNIRTQLLENWLNYTPRESPGGGLARHSQLAIIDAMVTGRGILMPEHYQMPGSQRNLTRCRWIPQKDQWFDPDATSRDDATWMFIEEWLPYWEAERRYGLKRDSLKDYASQESQNSRGERSSNALNKVHRAQGKTNDYVQLFHIWSRMGIGARLSGVNVDIKDNLEVVAGDYVYLCVSPKVPFILNCPDDVLDKNEDDIERRFRWRTPYFLDDRWPISFLEFYPRPGCPYPIAPLMPGLGELSYINIIVSHLAGRIWSSSRDFIVVMDHVAQYMEAELRGGSDQCIIKVPPMVKNVGDAVQWITQPETREDLWRIVVILMENFEKRVGLTPQVYGQQGSEAGSRSATDARQKVQAASVRMKYMQATVAAWQGECADMEKIETRFHVQGPDVRHRMGEVGEYFWTKYITDEEPELVMREMRATVEASSLRPPNKEKEVEDITGLMQAMGTEFSNHANATGDTRPTNAALRMYLKAMDMEYDPDLEMGPRVPQPPPPELQQQQQQMRELEMAKVNADVQKAQADVAVKQMDVELKKMELQQGGAELQAEQARSSLELQMDQIRGQQKLQMNREKHQDKMQMQREKAQMDMAVEQQKNQQKLMSDQLAQAVKRQQQAREAEMQMGMQMQKHNLQMQQMAMRPQPSTSGNSKA